MKRKGFTLVELLVVIGIIAVLISILLPALSKARRAAQSVQCLSNLKQMGVAVIMYTQNNSGFLPNGKLNTGAAVDTTYWIKVLWADIYPTKPVPIFDATYDGFLGTVFECPSMRDGFDRLDCTSRSPDPSQFPYNAGDTRSYGFNYKMGDGDATTCEKLTHIVRTSEVSMICDNYNLTQMNTYSVARRHSSLSANTLFCDGHAEAVQSKTALFNATDIFWGKQ